MGRPRLVFLGSPPFAVPSLQAAHKCCDIPLVLTQPDRPAGRGRKLVPTAVRQAAEDLGLPVRTYVPGERRQVAEELANMQLDVLLVVAFGHILKPALLGAARCGAVNVHASLLPRWRGSSPVEQSILAGDSHSGVTLMQLDAGVDTGPTIARRQVVIDRFETRISLLEKLAEEGAALVQHSLLPFLDGQLLAQAQPDEGALHAPRLQKQQGLLRWDSAAIELDRQVRAFQGWPGCYTILQGVNLKVHTAEAIEHNTHESPGVVLSADDTTVLVACGDNALRLKEVQLPGKRRVSAAELLRSGRLQVGMQFASQETDKP